MATGELASGPRLDSLAVSFNTGNLAAAEALGAVVPLEVPIGVDTTFTYSLVLRFGDGDAGVSRLAILTPWPARLDMDGIEGVDRAAIDAANTYATNDSLIIAFDPAHWCRRRPTHSLHHPHAGRCPQFPRTGFRPRVHVALFGAAARGRRSRY